MSLTNVAYWAMGQSPQIGDNSNLTSTGPRATLITGATQTCYSELTHGSLHVSHVLPQSSVPSLILLLGRYLVLSRIPRLLL